MTNIKNWDKFINEGKKDKFKYNKEGKCPECGSEILEYEDSEIDNNYDNKDYTCKKCGFEGTEVHKIVPKFVGHLKRIDTDPFGLLDIE